MKLRYTFISILFVLALSLTAFQIRLVNAVSNANGPITGPITSPITPPVPSPTPTPTPITPPTPIGRPLACGVYGDINQDKVISQKDVRMLLGHLVYLVGIKLSNEQKIAADVNKDGKINITDALTILKYVAGKINTFPACITPTPTPTPIFYTYPTPSYPTPSYATPTYPTPYNYPTPYSTPSYSTPSYNTPTYDTPSYGTPSYSTPGTWPTPTPQP